MDKKDVALTEFHVRKVVVDVAVATSYAQHVNIIESAQTGILQRLAAQTRIVHQHYLGYTYIIERYFFRGFLHSHVRSKAFRLLAVAAHIYDVAVRQLRVRTSKTLFHLLYQRRMALLYASHLQHGQPVTVMNVQFGKGLSVGKRICSDCEDSEIVRKTIFFHEIVQ